MSNDVKSPVGYDFFADVEGTRSLAHTLEAGVRFQTQLNAFKRLEKNLLTLPTRLQAIDEQKMLIPQRLQDEIAQQVELLEQVSATLDEQIKQHQAVLAPRVKALWQQIERNDELIGQDGYDAHAEAIRVMTEEGETLKVEMQQAEQQVFDSFNDLSNHTRQFVQELNALERTSQTLNNAAFMLNGSERLVHATEGSYHLSRKEQPKGILFLTTNCLIFEQREEVVKSRFLLFSQKEYVQKVRFTEALNQIKLANSKPQRNRKALHLALGSQAQVSEAVFELEHDVQKWVELLKDER